MPDIIQLLPDHIANQIAAGEVVQRPASVVKELMENSIDAGAKSIKLIVENAGKQLIQVMDDGCGMSETDARMSFERHATSKIRTIDDIYRLYTFGFRGEALASIAAASMVEMRTRRRDDEAGTLIRVEGSKVVAHEACSTAGGTSIAVKNLFFSIPARKNFLKANPVEMKHIIEEFLRVAIANPEIKFVLVSDREELYHFNTGSLRQRLISIFGKKYDTMLVPVEEETPMMKVKGFIGKPDAARKTRGEQYFFVNKRYIRSSYLHHSVQYAYEDLLPPDTHPFYILFLEIEPGKIDVNVHPTKTEIKFEEEKAIYAILRASIRKSLSQYHIAPALSFEKEDIVDPFMNNSNSPERETIKSRTGDAVARGGFQGSPYTVPARPARDEWEQLLSVLSSGKDEESSHSTPDQELFDDEVPSPEKQPFQLHNRYILSPLRSGLMIINQQAAHERILFEKYLEALSNNKSISQQKLFPEVVEFSTSDFQMVKEILPEINALGFHMEIFGKNSFIVNGLPADMTTQPVEKIFERLLEDYKRNLKVEKLETRENLARVLARSASVKAGTALGAEEMKLLIDELFACSMPYYSPDGKPAFITISSEELDKKFDKK